MSRIVFGKPYDDNGRCLACGSGRWRVERRYDQDDDESSGVEFVKVKRADRHTFDCPLNADTLEAQALASRSAIVSDSVHAGYSKCRGALTPPRRPTPHGPTPDKWWHPGWTAAQKRALSPLLKRHDEPPGKAFLVLSDALLEVAS